LGESIGGASLPDWSELALVGMTSDIGMPRLTLCGFARDKLSKGHGYRVPCEKPACWDFASLDDHAALGPVRLFASVGSLFVLSVALSGIAPGASDFGSRQWMWFSNRSLNGE
jgi:hypothetical protein